MNNYRYRGGLFPRKRPNHSAWIILRQQQKRKQDVSSRNVGSLGLWKNTRQGFGGKPCLFPNLLNTGTVLTCFVPALGLNPQLWVWVNLQSKAAAGAWPWFHFSGGAGGPRDTQVTSIESCSISRARWNNSLPSGTYANAILALQRSITLTSIKCYLLSIFIPVFLGLQIFVFCAVTYAFMHGQIDSLGFPAGPLFISFTIKFKRVQLMRGFRGEHLKCSGIKLLFVLQRCSLEFWVKSVFWWGFKPMTLCGFFWPHLNRIQ